MTEKIKGPAGAGPTGVPPADDYGDRPAPAVPPGAPSVPPRPAVPPAAATPDVPPSQDVPPSKVSGPGGWFSRQTPARIGAAAAAVVLIGLLVWWLAASGSGTPQPAAGTSGTTTPTASQPASRGQLPLESVSPLDFQLGDCFKDFDAAAPTSTVVDCGTGHSAQLVAVERYADGDSYPGRDPLKQRALDACKAAPLTEKQGEYVLSYKLAYPSSTSWDSGDRRVDCYVTADTGNVILESLIP